MSMIMHNNGLSLGATGQCRWITFDGHLASMDIVAVEQKKYRPVRQ